MSDTNNPAISTPLIEAILDKLDAEAGKDLPRPEYPRPQFVRQLGWINLNGEWGFEIDQGASGVSRGLHTKTALSGKIAVPFCPESKLSGVGYTDFMASVWYKREISIPAEWNSSRVLLHLGACDFKTWIYIDGLEIGTHVGGYTPFSLDITEKIKSGQGRVTITIRAEDNVRSGAQAKGKQSHTFNSQGCDYTRTTGIWQTVWFEAVPQSYLESAKLTPQIAADGLTIDLRIAGERLDFGTKLRAQAFADGKLVGETVSAVSGTNASLFLPLSEVKTWSTQTPFLYDLILTLENADGSVLDTVNSYFGMRSIELDGPAVLINDEPVFQRLILDQGFYPDGIYTAPTDSNLKRDIEISQSLGFNGARLHQKVFEPRFLYWADRMGYLCWGEAPDWGLNVENGEGFASFVQSWIEEIARDYNHPSIIGWCPFNEHDCDRTVESFRAIYKLTKALDSTRPVIDTSGWTHVETDIYDVHDYDQNPESFDARYQFLITGKGEIYKNKPAASLPGEWKPGMPYMVSEYGGIWWNPELANDKYSWGYGERPKTLDEFIERYRGLTEALLNNPKMFGFCYTQLTDVEQEVNGLVFYNREPKFDHSVMHAITSQRAAIEK